MKSKQINDDLKRAYRHLVDTVEELVVKDGKSFQQALHTAEDKLSEWNELSKQQVKDISAELSHDVHTLGESLHGAREAYKEQFKLDAAYVTDSVWDQLLKVMDTNTSQLQAFTQNLSDQVRELTTDEHITEHQAHTKWTSEHELWLSEIALWKKEHTQALSKLGEIEQKIKQHSDALDEHAQAIQAHEALSHEHEEAIANAEKDPSSQAFEETEGKESAIHAQEKQMHKQHAELHNAMKKHHLKTMSLIAEFYKKIATQG